MKMRLSHKKSRLGCQTCKKRKVKCDETKPQCSNCIRFGVRCDFSPNIEIPIAHNLEAPSSSGRRGRPRGDWGSWAEQIRLSSTKDEPGCCECSGDVLNVQDLELFYNYMNRTALTLGHDSLWLEGVPELGFQYPCILSLVLAFSAHHQARARPKDAPRFLRAAEHHSTKALQSATQLLQFLDKTNSPALYATSVLICFTAFAKGPTPGNILLVADDGQVPWLSLLKGVRLVISTMGWSSIFAGPLEKHFPTPGEGENAEETDQKDVTKSPNTVSLTSKSLEDWRSSLNEVSDLIPVFAEERCRMSYMDELNRLAKCYESTFGSGQNAEPKTCGQMQVVMSWIYSIDELFVEGLQRKDPVPLIILGHFCVLLRTLEQYWFIEGWASHIMQEILHISEASSKWLRWPMQFLYTLEREEPLNRATGRSG